MKILAIYDNSGPKYHRILLPLSLMPDVEFSFARELSEENTKVDIVFVNRLVGNTSLQTVCDLREKNGFKLIVDFDDHWRLDPSHTLYDLYKKTHATELMELYIKEADCVTVTHERLFHEVFPFNQNVHILPNAIPFFGQFTYKKTESERTRLFWAGSSTHIKDIELLRNPIRKIKDLPVEMVLGGYGPNDAYKRMASAFTNGGSMSNKLLEALPVEQYYAMYSECDISLTPLLDTSFNQYKSNLKILEAANIAAPVIVSNVHPYKDMEYVNYVNSQSDWVKHIRRLVNNPGEALFQGERLREYCRERFNFEKINTERKQIFDATVKH